MIVIKNVAYINFIKAFWPVICLHSYLYFSLITVQIKWLLCLNHIHIFSNFSFFLQNSDICILTRPHYIFHSSSRPLQKLYLKWDSKVLLPVSAPPQKRKKNIVCILFCVLIIKEVLDTEVIHCSRKESILSGLRCAKNVQLIGVQVLHYLPNAIFTGPVPTEVFLLVFFLFKLSPNIWWQKI